MQSAVVVASKSGVATGNGQSSAAAGDEGASGGVDFSAMLAAQIQADQGASLNPVLIDVAVDTLSLQDGKYLDFPSETGVDPLMAGMMLAQAIPSPVVAVVLQPVAGSNVDVLAGVRQVPMEARGEIATRLALLTAKSAGDDKSIAKPSLTDFESGFEMVETSFAGMGREKAEEFAVSGKGLPLALGVDRPLALGVDRPLALSVDNRNLDARTSSLPLSEIQPKLDPMPGILTSMSAAGQTVPAAEVKAAATVQVPVGNAAWGEAVGQKVVWMASQQQQVAELHLNPPNLGPMEVRLTINNDQVSAIFVSHQPAVREALEAAMPRLREMFADSGMMLGNTMVGSDSLPQQQSSGQERDSGSGRRQETPISIDGSASASMHGVLPLRGDGRGMVDLFA